MTEKQPSCCCPEDSWGAPLDVPHESKTLDGAGGQIFMIGPEEGLEVYVASPKASAAAAEKKAIMVFTDV